MNDTSQQGTQRRAWKYIKPLMILAAGVALGSVGAILLMSIPSYQHYQQDMPALAQSPGDAEARREMAEEQFIDGGELAVTERIAPPIAAVIPAKPQPDPLPMPSMAEVDDSAVTLDSLDQFSQDEMPEPVVAANEAPYPADSPRRSRALSTLPQPPRTPDSPLAGAAGGAFLRLEDGDYSPSPPTSGRRQNERPGQGTTSASRDKRVGRSGFAMERADPDLNAPQPPPPPPEPMEAASFRNDRMPLPQPSLSGAETFLNRLDNLDGLIFQPAQGYWSNRYLPGDPLMRVLSARLARLGDSGQLNQITATARQNLQPFDPPENAALALYLSADKVAVNETSRLRLQIGLQGTPRLGGQRPAMNLAMVLDRRGLDDANLASAARALLLELAQGRQAGDHFSLVVSGQAGIALGPEAFRFGALQLTLDKLSGQPASHHAGELYAAIETAAAQLRRTDDPDSPLGSSAVLLLTAAPLPPQDPALEALAHANAVAGIGLSVIGLGQAPQPNAVERLVLAGQGQRWVLQQATDAGRLAEQVLFAASRAVARAVRLRIALAPGVKLVEVLDAEKLDEPQAQRVREAEQQIDLRMARNLGIRADRGEDEQGIQIVIPHFFADSSHVVMVDLVVPGPGPVAEVGVRYKDLVYGRNGIARAQLSLPVGEDQPGPLQRNVLKNRLAQELAEQLRRAGESLAANNPVAARQVLLEARALLDGMQQAIPGWEQDPALLADRQILATALSALDRQQPNLGPALQLAAYRRLTAKTMD